MNSFLLMMLINILVLIFVLLMFWFAIPAFGRWLVRRYGREVER